MKKSKSQGQLLHLKFSDRPSPVYGIIVSYSDDWNWVLMQNMPYDYIIDGYIIVRNKNVSAVWDDRDTFTQTVMKLKNQTWDKAVENIPLDSLKSILSHLTKKYGVFKFETTSEKCCYIGKLKTIDSKKLVIDFLDPKGKWVGPRSFRPGDVRVIEFDIDYINSLKLISSK